MPVLEIKNISKSYDKHLVLNNISMTLPRGCIYGLLGPNGAGKTTLIRIINKIIMPDHGDILFDGRKMIPADIEKIGYLPEERGLYGKMKVGEQLLYLAKLKGFSGSKAKTEISRLMSEFDTLGWWNNKVETLSKGMQQKLQFIVAIMHKPVLVILDEPFSGFDPINIELVKNKILKLRDEGTSVILSTHRMDSVEELCDDITLINKSNKIIEEKIQDIKQKFKENIYEIIFQTNNGSQVESNNQLFSLVNSENTDSENTYKIKIRLFEGVTINQVLQFIMPDAVIISLHEVIPSINQIFISLVKEVSNV